MAGLTARFSLIDDMSSRLADIAESGQNMISHWERAGDAMSNALDGISGNTAAAASAVDGVAVAVTGLKGAADGVSSSAGILADSINAYGDAAGDAAAKTDYWTDAVGNYDESVLEAIYSTEELVEMGFKSADALEEQERMLELCEQAANELGTAMEAASDGQEELAAAIEAAAEVTEELSRNEEVSAETKEALARASTEAAEAMNELQAAQEEAAAAMEAYDAVISSGTTDLETLESAAERAGHAAEALAQANERASGATEELSRATEQASEKAEEGDNKGVNAVETIASALAAAGITVTVKEITESVYGLVDAFSEAESIVVLATGATGGALDRLTDSMMSAYAASRTGSLEDTAAAVGEINTRLGYTDGILTETTGLFLDFAAVTGGNAATAVRSVTQLMNQWSIPASEMEIILDRLTYAGQASGISVDSLSQQLTSNKAILDQLGFSLDEATAMFMNFELAGTNSTAVMTGFRTALSSGAISSLEELHDVFDQISSGAITAADASEMFGSRAGPAIVDAVNSGILSLDDMVASLEGAGGTLATTADAAQTLEQKWTQASNNISAAFTSAVEPAVTGVSSGLADLTNGIGDFLNENQTFTKVITAAGVGIGVVAVGISGVAFATEVAIPAVTAFGAAFNAALGPVGWVALGITAVVAAGTALVTMLSDATDETAGMSAITRNQYHELQDLNAEYERACEQYGETSDEASTLKYQIDDLSAAFEENGKTVEELAAECDAIIQKHSELIDSADEAAAAIQQEDVANLALIAKLDDLASASDGSAAAQGAMQSIIDELNGSIDGLNLTYEDLISNQDATIQSLKDMAQAQAECELQRAKWEEYVECLKQQAIQQEKIAEVTNEVAAATEWASAANQEYSDYLTQMAQYDPTGMAALAASFSSQAKEVDAASEAYQTAVGSLEELEATAAKTDARIAELEEEFGFAGDAAEKAGETTVSAEDAAAMAISAVQTELEELCAAYDEAYQAALSSFEGQFGLFDEAQADMDATVANAQAALDSQLAYWDSYAANLEVLRNTSAEDLGITQENYDALMALVQDGSAEAAGLAASMAEAINSDSADAVTALANTVGEVSAKQQEIAAMTADWQTDFTAQMDAIEQEMQATVEGMNLSDEAAASATATISSYADSILAGKAAAVAAAQEVANAVSAALASANATVNVRVGSRVAADALGTTNAESIFLAGELGPELVARPAAAYATGTTDSSDFFIAGENGPELIVGEQGSTVFPTSETDRLIDALNTRRRPLQVFAGDGGESGNSVGGQAAEQFKRILLEIAGSGTIEVGGSGGVDRDAVLEIIVANLKPVLMQILQGEIYEEGDLSYDY